MAEQRFPDGNGSTWTYRRFAGGVSLRWQLLASLLALTLGSIAFIAVFSYRASAARAQEEVFWALDIAAAGREEHLLHMLHRRRDRLQSFLAVQAPAFQRTADQPDTGDDRLEGALAAFLAAEQAMGLRFVPPAGSPVTLGTPIDGEPRGGQLARFDLLEGGGSSFLLSAHASEAGRLTVRYPTEAIEGVFVEQYGRGRTGRAFLVHPTGALLMPSDPAPAGTPTSRPIPPVARCLTGADGQVVAADDRGHSAVQAYRFIDEIGGGCMVVQVPRDEAFAAGRHLRSTLVSGALLFGLLAVVLSVVLANRVAAPVRKLAERTRALQRGEFDRPVPVDGPAELRAFASSFAAMVEAVRASRAALEASEARKGAILDAAIDAIITIDHTGRVLDFNPAAVSTFGHARDHAVGKRLADLIIPPDLRERHSRALDRHVATGQSTLVGRRVEMRALRADGSELPIEVAITRLPSEGPPVFTGYIRDISERRESERRMLLQYAVTRILAEANTVAEALEGILEAVCDGLRWDVAVAWRTDDLAGLLRCARVWHRGAAEIPQFLGLTEQMTFAPGIGLPGRVWLTGEPVWVPDVARDANFPRAFVAAASNLRAALAVPIRLGPQMLGVLEFFGRVVPEPGEDLLRMLGTIGGQLGQFIERKRAEEDVGELLSREQAARVEAEEAERRAAFLGEASTVLASSLDHDRTLATLARLAVPVLADLCVVDLLEPDGSIRRVAAECVTPRHEELVRELIRDHPPDPTGPHPVPQVLRTGRSAIAADLPEDTLPGLFPDPRHLRIARELGYRSHMVVPLFVRGQIFGAISFVSMEAGRRYGMRDLLLAEELGRRAAVAMDHARLYQEAQRANRAKDEFLATVSHELRTPLNAMLGWTQLLRIGQLSEDARRRAFDSIERNMRVQVQLIEDLLDVSRIITGKLRLSIEPVRLPEVIGAAVDAIRPAAAAKQIDVLLALDPVGGAISGDPDRIQQILWNLLSNGIKFTPAGGRVTVRLERVDPFVEVSISDTGSGIPKEFLPHVFDRFRQADSTATRTQGGLGLGLAIVRHLTELHGGTVRAESPGEGRGATFTVQFPVRAIAAPEADPALVPPRPGSPGSGAPEPSLAGVRVLVVDDEPDARELIQTVLAHYGAEVTTAASVEEALLALVGSVPNVLVSDVGMPGEDGYALIRQVRALETDRGLRIPAVALTAYARVEDRHRALRAGFARHLAKPVEPLELVSVISAVVKPSAPV
jgi:PAS domain S-box-containing protein